MPLRAPICSSELLNCSSEHQISSIEHPDCCSGKQFSSSEHLYRSSEQQIAIRRSNLLLTRAISIFSSINYYWLRSFVKLKRISFLVTWIIFKSLKSFFINSILYFSGIERIAGKGLRRFDAYRLKSQDEGVVLQYDKVVDNERDHSVQNLKIHKILTACG